MFGLRLEGSQAIIDSPFQQIRLQTRRTREPIKKKTYRRDDHGSQTCSTLSGIQFVSKAHPDRPNAPKVLVLNRSDAEVASQWLNIIFTLYNGCN
eukprot:1009039-Amphidinium_carterae.1